MEFQINCENVTPYFAADISTVATEKIRNSFIHPLDNHISAAQIAAQWNEIVSYKEKLDKDAELKQIKQAQERNRRLRGLIKHVNWSGKCCIVYWADGTQTKAFWDDDEVFDPEKAILVCMARKLYEGTGLYNEVLKKYAPEGRKAMRGTNISLLDYFNIYLNGKDDE